MTAADVLYRIFDIRNQHTNGLYLINILTFYMQENKSLNNCKSIFFFFNFQQLYTLGARKVIVTAVGQIGCIPYQLARYSGNNSTRCNENINGAISLFNSELRKMVDRFNNGQLPGAKFIYLDSYKSTSDIYVNASNYGNLVIYSFEP